ncbi:MAG: hypothetical protein ETSY2_20075 [Candidatus Entotheonella gemina]|uniref:DUF4258 domain-containing protein n=1 Tax=Candidatus Entotheonella gemina TaxID=1429439 RepID=W4M7P9_9BACT|nr:MAG: hypothetical protein ETSY2_20075 [Candidatus Entotheonella gemina]
MELPDQQAFIDRKARENIEHPDGTQMDGSRHAITEMIQDQLTRSEVETALADCEIIEDYPTTHRSLPDCLVLGRLPNTQPLHAVAAIDEARDRIFVVTIYRPSPKRWEHDWRTRKSLLS